MEKLPDTVLELQTDVYKKKKDCFEDLGDAQFRKRRRECIRTINAGGIPRASTLNKYNITYDSVSNLYI